MSIPFNDTTTLKGLVQIYEKEIGADRGFVSGNTNRLKEFTADVNLAWDDYMTIAGGASGLWQFDDSAHTKYPIIYFNIGSGQQDYPFTTDEQGNLILDIYKVAILSSATETLYQEIAPIDAQSSVDAQNLVADQTATGTPTRYDKTANAIFLDPTPGYTVSKGIKIYINREASYFTSTDTTKMPGVPGLHHRYFALKPALDYARRNNLANYATLREEVMSYEGDESRRLTGSIAEHFAKRSRDERAIIKGKKINFI